MLFFGELKGVLEVSHDPRRGARILVAPLAIYPLLMRVGSVHNEACRSVLELEVAASRGLKTQTPWFSLKRGGYKGA